MSFLIQGSIKTRREDGHHHISTSTSSHLVLVRIVLSDSNRPIISELDHGFGSAVCILWRSCPSSPTPKTSSCILYCSWITN
jgi:hypothetical protein